MWKLLPEGVIHVSFQITGFGVLNDRSLREEERQIGNLTPAVQPSPF